MKKKSKFSLIIICLVITLVSIGLSYAYWRFAFISDNANKGTSGCFNIELAEEKDEINLTNQDEVKTHLESNGYICNISED